MHSSGTPSVTPAAGGAFGPTFGWENQRYNHNLPRTAAGREKSSSATTSPLMKIYAKA